MLRLLLLVAATLVGLFFLSLAYDSGDSAVTSQSPESETSQAPATSVAEGTKELIAEVVAGPKPNGAEGAPPDDLVKAADQTPEKIQKFPGPKLRPSPEYAGETPAPVAASTTRDSQTLYVTAERVNFRAGPSTNDRVIGALDGGATVEALGPTDAEWINIRDASGRIGYLSGQFLSTQAPN